MENAGNVDWLITSVLDILVTFNFFSEYWWNCRETVVLFFPPEHLQVFSYSTYSLVQCLYFLLLNLFLLLSFVLFNHAIASAKCKDATKGKEISCAIAPHCSDTCLNFALRGSLFFLNCSFVLVVSSVSFGFRMIRLLSFKIVENTSFRWV